MRKSILRREMCLKDLYLSRTGDTHGKATPASVATAMLMLKPKT